MYAGSPICCVICFYCFLIQCVCIFLSSAQQIVCRNIITHITTHNMSTGCRLLLLVAVSTTILSSALTYAGPARSFAMAAARASKIPRSIRAPFRNSETMVARGFGKRSQMAHLKEGMYKNYCFCIACNSTLLFFSFSVGEPWSYIKHGAGGRVYSVVDNVADLDEILNELPEERWAKCWSNLIKLMNAKYFKL